MAEPLSLDRSSTLPSAPQQNRFPPVLIMYHPSMRTLAENLVARVEKIFLEQQVS